jgi:hypothetical protein
MLTSAAATGDARSNILNRIVGIEEIARADTRRPLERTAPHRTAPHRTAPHRNMPIDKLLMASGVGTVRAKERAKRA